jgi:hypothetical protein
METVKPKNKGGRPKKHLDYEQLEELCRIQCTGEECAAVLKMTYETLNARLKADKHGGFLEYFKSKSGYGKASLRRLQWRSAQSGNTSMLIWLGKQYLGQTDKQEATNEIKPLPIIDYRESKQSDI